MLNALKTLKFSNIFKKKMKNYCQKMQNKNFYSDSNIN